MCDIDKERLLKCCRPKKGERLKKAKEQANMEQQTPERIIELVNDLLRELGMEQEKSAKKTIQIHKGISASIKDIYDNIDHNLNGRESTDKVPKQQTKTDIIWLKFTEDGFLGVVAKGRDINFRENNTSSKMIEEACKSWNKEFVLVFPLINIPKNLTANKIERMIGNYLIENNVPIIDFYSHNW